MKTKIKRFTPWFALLALLGAVGLYGFADLSTIQLNKELGLQISRYTTTNEVRAIRIKYIGSVAPGAAGPTLEIDASGDLIFTLDATAADTTIGIPTLDGTIDVSDAAGNTWGEVVDAINASANWQGVMVDVLPSNLSNNTLLLMAETNATTGLSATFDLDGNGIYANEGIPVVVELAQVDEITSSIGPEYSIDELLTVSNDNLLNRQMNPSVSGEPNWRAELYKVTANATFSAGTALLQIWLVEGQAAGATEVLVWQQVGAATTVDNVLDLTDLPPIRGVSGLRLIIKYQIITSPVATVGVLQVHGLIYQE